MAKFDHIPDWRGARVAVLGYGVEGRSSVEYLLKHEAKVEVHDDAKLESLTPEWMEHLKRGVTFWAGGQGFTHLSDYDWVIRSPGVHPARSELTDVDRNIITSQTEIFLTRWREHCVGITGSKGKGTTATLLVHFLRQAGRRVLVGGNIGQPLLDVIDQMNDATTAVLELSSFQLQDIEVSPAVAVVLMVIPEHLNYHGTSEAYVLAKSQIVSWQKSSDLAITNDDFELSRFVAAHIKGNHWKFGTDTGCQARLDEETVSVQLDGRSDILACRQDMPMRGTHNLQNVAAAGLAGLRLGLSISEMRKAVPSYQPLPHRLSLAAKNKRLAFYDDSFATTPEAAAAALDSFNEPVSMIIGGASKGSDFYPLLSALKRCAGLKGVVVIGDIAEQLAGEIQAIGIEVPMIVGQRDIRDMVNSAVQFLGDDGGAIVLSPGAASFGLFKDYKDRGDQFAAAARHVIESSETAAT